MLKELGLYIHIPFCIKKCSYCDFNSHSADTAEQEEYVSALICELESISAHTKGHYLNTIFFGGGTPSILQVPLFEKICDCIRRSFNIDDSAEFTVECNPGTVDFNKMKAYKSLGVNRLSFGVQSLDENTLKVIGRVHTLGDFYNAYAASRLAGFTNINYDLMFSLPNQTQENWEYTLEKILKYEPTHISAYALKLEEGTPMYENRGSYTFPDDEADRRMYHTACEILKSAGFERYEISNFAKQGFKSRHNLKYWDMSEYIGAGLGASSYFDGVRYENPQKMDEYIKFTQSFTPLYKEHTPLTQNEQMEEFMFLALRTEAGVSAEKFADMFSKDMFALFEKPINTHTQNRLLENDGQRIYLTDKGFDLANFVMSDFLL